MVEQTTPAGDVMSIAGDDHPLRKAFIVAAAGLMFEAMPAFAVDPSDQTTFELGPGVGTDEGGLTNILGDGLGATGPDWADIFDASGGVVNLFGGTAASFVKDDVSSGGATDRTAYPKGGSDKNSGTIASWNWQSASVPAKDDISNAYVYATTIGGHLIVYAGVEREDPSGDSHIDIEFFQNRVGLAQDPPCTVKGGCEFTGSNEDGDLLVNMDFSIGGSFAGLELRKRLEGAQNNYDLIETIGTEGCDATHTACAFANGGSIDGGPWDNFDNHGSVITTLEAKAFTEFGIDVTELLGTTPCFATVQVKTRSSGSFTAELKDFALASFQQCTAGAATEIHSGASVGATHTAADIQNTSVAVGTTVHDKAIVTGTPGFDTPTGTVTFSRFNNASCGAPAVGTETVSLTETLLPTPTTAGTAAAESSSFTTTTSGSLSYQAVYDGDTNYPDGATSACEPLTVNRTNSAVNTDIRRDNINGDSVLNTKISTGTTVVDVATITGSAPGTPDPTGDVTFQRFANANCSGDPPASTETVPLVPDANPNDGTATAVSSTYTTSAAAGEFVSYKVLYSGDSVYFPSAATLCEPICSFTNSPTLP